MKWKVAILEDDPYQLKDLKETLSLIPELDVVAWATGSQEFLEKVQNVRPDLIIVDINLNSDPSSGILVAHRLKLPVIFASGNNAAYLKDIEALKRDQDLPVDHITKPIREVDLMKTVDSFLRDLNIRRSVSYVWLKLGEIREKVQLSDIVYIAADKSHGSESNNKLICFTQRKPEVLIDFSFVRMAEHGFDMSRFVQIHKSFVVNKEHLFSYDPQNKVVRVKVSVGSDQFKEVELPVSDNYRQHLKHLF